jgi:hypothetical protein
MGRQTQSELPEGWKNAAFAAFRDFMQKEADSQSVAIEQVAVPFTVSVESEEPDADTVEETRKSYNKRNRTRAVELLIAGTSITKTAELIGVCRTTVNAWLKRPDFKGELDRRTKEVMERSNLILQSAAVEVAATLVNIALNAVNDPADRIRAASKVLDLAHGLSTLKDARALLEEVKTGESDADASASKSTYTRSAQTEISSETA